METGLLRQLLDTMPDGCLLTDIHGHILEVNQTYCRLTGYTPGQLRGRTLDQLDVLPEPVQIRDWMERMVAEGGLCFQTRHQAGDGSLLELELRINLLSAGDEPLVAVFVRDLTDTLRQQHLERMQRELLEIIATHTDALEETLEAMIRVVETHSPGMLGSVLLLDETGSRIAHVAAPSLPPDYTAAIDGAEIGPCHGSCGTAAYRGERVIVEDIASDPLWENYRQLALPHDLRACWSEPVRDRDGKVLGTFAMYYRTPRAPQSQEIRIIEAAARMAALAIEHVRAEQRLVHLSHYDDLTGLPNRRLFNDRLQQAIARARRGGSNLCLLYFDLNRFKMVNDTLGHDAGDLLLRETARRLSGLLRESDTLARLGGDEFAVLLGDADLEEGSRVAYKILGALHKPLYLGTQELLLDACIGLVRFPQDGEDATTLLKHADLAMYRAKEEGVPLTFFSSEMASSVRERMRYEQALGQAIEQGGLSLAFQPIFRAGEQPLAWSCEALTRWQDPELGCVPPSIFIPLAEETGRIQALTEWLVEALCRQALAWERHGCRPRRIWFNLSPLQLIQHRLASALLEQIRSAGASPEWFGVELTESAAMRRPEIATAIMRTLDEAGLAVAIDDFGTGYSSLSQLKRLPASQLKIDHSFIRDLPEDADDLAIVRSIIALAHAQGLEVVAKGVENEAQLKVLESEGCDLLQGHSLARPQDARTVGALFAGATARSENLLRG